MGNLAVETTSVAQCIRLYRALGDQTGVWVEFGGRRLRLVQLEELECDEEVRPASVEVGSLQYLRDVKKVALCLKVQYVSHTVIVVYCLISQLYMCD